MSFQLLVARHALAPDDLQERSDAPGARLLVVRGERPQRLGGDERIQRQARLLRFDETAEKVGR